MAKAATTAPTAELGYGAPNAGAWWGSIDEQTPELRWPQNLAVYERMRSQDTQVGSVLRAVTMPVLRTSWRIAPNGARDEVVEQIAEDLGLPIDGAEPKPMPRTRDRFSWHEHLRVALTMSLAFGHMPFEQVCRVDERGRVRLRKLAPRMPATISEWDVALDGGLRSITQAAPIGPVRSAPGPRKPATIPVSRLVVYVNEREGGNWRGRSILRTAYKFWLLKDRMLRVGAQSVERNGMGVPLYKGAPRESDLTPGRKIAENWRSGDASGAAIGNGADLILKGVEGDLPDAERWARYYDEQIAKSALLHFFNLGQQAGTGSYALGATFLDFFTMSTQTFADDAQDVGNAHIVEDLVDWNWGPDEPAPRLICDEIGARHPATADAIKLLTDAGVVLPDRELEEFVRQLHGLPPKGSYSRPAGPAPAPDSAAVAVREALATLERIDALLTSEGTTT